MSFARQALDSPTSEMSNSLARVTTGSSQTRLYSSSREISIATSSFTTGCEWGACGESLAPSGGRDKTLATHTPSKLQAPDTGNTGQASLDSAGS
jgi:hypothetical protein